MRKYTPRRASKRWLDGDCPDGVLAIFDNKKFADRYTVFYKDVIEGWGENTHYIGFRGMSENPSHPQGVGMYGEMKSYEVADYRYRNSHRACKWTDLPEAVRKCVISDLASEE